MEETARAGKRLLPVMLAQVPDKHVPERLRTLNYVFFGNDRSFSTSLGDVARALRADAGWIREHTRYGELAIRWVERNKPTALLLRGSDLDDAKRWVVARPSDAPEISTNQQAYIEASARAFDEELAAKAKLRRRTLVAITLFNVALAAGAGVSYWQWQVAETAKESLAASNKMLQRTVREVDATNARLERKLALRAAPRGYEPYDVPAGWFQVATRYAGAVAFVERLSEPNQLTASGVLVDARLLNPDWTERAVFVTATYAVAKDSPVFTSALPPAEVQIVMLGPKNERRTARLGSILWQSENLGVSVSSVEDALPSDVFVIKSANFAPEALSNLEPLTTAKVGALFDDKAMLGYHKEHRPIVFVGNLQGRGEVAISISHLLGALDASRVGDPRVMANVSFGSAAFRKISGHSSRARSRSDAARSCLHTRNAARRGGSPIFDAETGDLIGIHLLSYPCAQSLLKRCAAVGTSFPRLLAAIRAQ